MTREYAIRVTIGEKQILSNCATVYEAAIRVMKWSRAGYPAELLHRENGSEWAHVPFGAMHYVRCFASMHLENWDAEHETEDQFLDRLWKIACPSIDSD